jgi:NAD(P)H-dependent FMN reductase
MSYVASAPLRLVVLLGSTRPTRFGDKLSSIIVNKLKEKNHEVQLLDAREEKFPLLEKPIHHYQNPKEAPEYLQKWAEILRAADGYVICDCEYNHGPSPGMVNLLDHFFHNEFLYKPAAIATYSGGAGGGQRSVFALRNMLSEVGLLTTPMEFNLGSVFAAFSETGEFKDANKDQQINNLIAQLEFLAETLKEGRKKGIPKK